jgi:Ca2+-binding EF-hand superfamily protein
MMDSVTWHLSKDSIKKLRCIFEDIDSDSSGRISQDELIQACNKLSIDVENNQLKHFLESDVSGDGELDFHEFCLFYLACLRSIFSEIDIDNSGSIGVDELKRAFSKVGFHATDREVLSLLAQVDKDNSETVDFSEFCNFFCSLPAPDFRLIVEKWASGLSVDTGIFSC